MGRMAKVYISSTLVDLDAQRELVVKELVNARHLPSHSYRSSPEPLVATCERDVAESEIYVLLLGRRYGYRPPVDNPDRLSITHLEFRAAVRQGKPIIALDQANPPMALSDADQGRDEDEASRKAFRAEVNARAVPAFWSDDVSLLRGVLNGVNDALQRLQAQKSAGAPPITPGAAPPHARLLSRSLLLVHLAGADDVVAQRLAGTLQKPEIGWTVETYRWSAEAGIDWRGFDQALARCRGMAVLFTDGNDRYRARQRELDQLLEFGQRQVGFVAGLRVAGNDADLEWLRALPLRQLHDLRTWAAGAQGALTADLSGAVRDMRSSHADLEDTKLVGLQCAVVAMNRGEAEQLRDDPALQDELTGPQRRFLTASLQRAQELDVHWVERYGVSREDWQPFGPRDGSPRPVLDVLREVMEDINGQEVMTRRDQEALRGHRMRLRPYRFEPLMTGDARAQVLEQVIARRLLVLVDELSLCHPHVREVAQGTLADPRLAVATVAPFDPPSFRVEEAISRNIIPQIDNLKNRFLVTRDPACELNLASTARVMRWLRLSIPETLTSQGTGALQENRSLFRTELGLDR
jgi:hypothetical protein